MGVVLFSFTLNPLCGWLLASFWAAEFLGYSSFEVQGKTVKPGLIFQGLRQLKCPENHDKNTFSLYKQKVFIRALCYKGNLSPKTTKRAPCSQVNTTTCSGHGNRGAFIFRTVLLRFLAMELVYRPTPAPSTPNP